ncbi:MAG TPA: universal stress protein [Solirubrobacteraceae bacterium]
MIAAVVALLVGLALGALAALEFERRRRGRALSRRAPVHRIAFPFTGEGLSEPALVAALRLARAEGATLMPVYLALVPLRLSVEVPLPVEAAQALPLLEAIEQRALRAHVPVDSRIERGRTVRHAMREMMEHEHFERMVVAAGANGLGDGFSAEDVAWLVEHAPGELIALRPAQPTTP